MADGASTKKTFDFTVLKRVFAFAKPYKNKLYLSVFLAILLALFSPLRPWLIQLSIKDGIEKKAADFLIHITLIQIALLVVETICRFVFTFSTASLGQSVVKDLRDTTFKKILNLNLRQFDRTPIGTLTTRTVNDIESINEIFSDGLIPIIADLLSIISVVTYMFWVDGWLTLICLAPFPILILATYIFKESVNKSFIRVRNAVAALNAFVQEHITGMAVVQAFAAEEKEAKKFNQINKEHRDANIKGIFAYSVFFPVVELILATSTGLLVWYTGGKQDPELAAKITSFILCLNLLFRPLRILADKFNVLQMGVIASERVFKVLDNDDTIVHAKDEKLNSKNETTPNPKHQTMNLNGRIEFQNVSFAYDDANYVLKDVSFIINPGETLAIVGHTGSGKTSIISLLNRMYEANKGAILADDKNILDYDVEYLRSQIAVVLQDVFLFSGSVMDNVTLHNADIKKEQVIEAAKLTGIHDFIMQLPGGYEYNVMERGATLSLGQRQLLSFVRAILFNPSILILDEATSSVDSYTETLIQQAIDTLISGRTSIIIAHRLSTIRKANRILVLDKGEVKEAGTHDELLTKGGYYARLHQMQFEKAEQPV